jgi:hypothetical protein
LQLQRLASTMMVRIAEVMAEVTGSNPGAWQAEAEDLAAGMRAAVTRDWRGHPCLSWVDAERLFLRMLRDRAQLDQEQSERLVEIERRQRGHIPGTSFADPAYAKAGEVG